MMKQIKILIFFFLILSCNGGRVDSLFKSIPKQILEWKAVEKDVFYNRKTLYDYMDGGAEMYLAYNFQRVFTRRYQGPEDNEITLDVYDMGSSPEAFGIFSCDREDPDVGIGQGSGYGTGLLRFWKDRYFVSIIAIGDDKIAEPAILELGKAVASAIDSTGPEPPILNWLPETGLIKNRTSFFHSDISLNNRFFIASENILQLSDKTNGVLAEFLAYGKKKSYLLLIEYEDAARAKLAYETFVNSYMPEAGDTGSVQTENGKWTVVKTDQNILTIVLEAPKVDWAQTLQTEVMSKINER